MTPNLKEKFFIPEFISGLRKEIKHLMNVLNPRKLNDTFNFAYKFELNFERYQKRYKGVSKQQPSLKYPIDKEKYKDKEGKSPTSTNLVPYKDRQLSFKGGNITFEQSIVLELCQKCNKNIFQTTNVHHMQ
jgi:hypothetical protein